MALDLNHAHSLTIKTKHTVNGYIRELQNSLSISVPSGLITLINLTLNSLVNA